MSDPENLQTTSNEPGFLKRFGAWLGLVELEVSGDHMAYVRAITPPADEDLSPWGRPPIDVHDFETDV